MQGRDKSDFQHNHIMIIKKSFSVIKIHKLYKEQETGPTQKFIKDEWFLKDDLNTLKILKKLLKDNEGKF